MIFTLYLLAVPPFLRVCFEVEERTRKEEKIQKKFSSSYLVDSGKREETGKSRDEQIVIFPLNFSCRFLL